MLSRSLRKSGHCSLTIDSGAQVSQSGEREVATASLRTDSLTLTNKQTKPLIIRGKRGLRLSLEEMKTRVTDFADVKLPGNRIQAYQLNRLVNISQGSRSTFIEFDIPD